MTSTPLPRPSRETRPHYKAIATLWRWRIVDAEKPVPLSSAMQLGAAILHALKLNAWTIRGSAELPICIHGPDQPLETEWKHDHAFFLAEDADNDGQLDHVSVFAKAGLDPQALRLLVATDRVMLDGNKIILMPHSMGQATAATHAGPARRWRSITPYIAPNRRFDEKDCLKQLRYEVKERTLGVPLISPGAAEMLKSPADIKTANEFDLTSDPAHPRPKGSEPRLCRLTFSEPVSGPLAFGWGCHTGMGQFVPDDSCEKVPGITAAK